MTAPTSPTIAASEVNDFAVDARMGVRLQAWDGSAWRKVACGTDGTLTATTTAGTDRSATGAITTTQDVPISTQDCGACGVQVTGTWTGTLVFEATVNAGTTWNAVNAEVPTTGVEVTSATANGVWLVQCGGYQQVRVRGNTVGSGSATIYLDASMATAVVSLGSPLPTGANTIGAVTVSGVATAANQATEITSLASIDGHVDGLEASASSIDTKLSSQATAANQSTSNTSLASIDTKLSSQATAANQSTSNTSLASIATSVAAATPAGTNLIGSVKLSDGTTVVDVLAASTAAQRTNKALPTSESPATPWTTVNQNTFANGWVAKASAGILKGGFVQIDQALASQVMYITITDEATVTGGAGKTLLYPPFQVVHTLGSTDTIDLPNLKKVAATGVCINASSTGGATVTLVAAAITGSSEVAA